MERMSGIYNMRGEILSNSVLESPQVIGFSNGFASRTESVLNNGADLVELKEVERKGLFELENRFQSFNKLNPELSFSDISEALTRNRDLLSKIIYLNEKGHDVSFLYEKDGNFVFVSSWLDVRQVSSDHRYLVYDDSVLQGLKDRVTLAKALEKRALLNSRKLLQKGVKPEISIVPICNGDAVSIASSLGVKLASPLDQELLNMFFDIKGRAWLDTDFEVRAKGKAYMGRDDGIFEVSPDCCLDFASFRAKIEVPRG